jgi:hypothetical protein
MQVSGVSKFRIDPFAVTASRGRGTVDIKPLASAGRELQCDRNRIVCAQLVTRESGPDILPVFAAYPAMPNRATVPPPAIVTQPVREGFVAGLRTQLRLAIHVREQLDGRPARDIAALAGDDHDEHRCETEKQKHVAHS